MVQLQYLRDFQVLFFFILLESPIFLAMVMKRKWVVLKNTNQWPIQISPHSEMVLEKLTSASLSKVQRMVKGKKKKAKNCKTFYENLDQAGLQLEHAKVDKTSVCSILTLLLACDRFIEMFMPRLSCCVRIYSCHFNCTLRNTKKSYLLYDIKHLKTGSILILHSEIPKHVC